MGEIIKFTVRGDPVGKARPRVTRWGTYTPPKTKEFEMRVVDSWREQSNVSIKEDVPIKMTLLFHFGVPKSYSNKKRESLIGQPHTKLPDVDNCIKAIADGIQGYAFRNDSYVSDVSAKKIYDEEGYTEVTIEAAE